MPGSVATFGKSMAQTAALYLLLSIFVDISMLIKVNYKKIFFNQIKNSLYRSQLQFGKESFSCACTP